MSELKDMTGLRFGKLVVLHRADDHIDPKGNRVVRWLCKCDCGAERIARGKDLRLGAAVSCGCSKVRRFKTVAKEKKENTDSCLYNQGITCYTFDCNKCGWNPDNNELREERLEKLKERMP